MDLTDKYSFKFKGRNCLVVYNEEGKVHTYIAIPPKEYGTDIISLGHEPNKHYTHNFQGLVVISTRLYRQVFHKGRAVATISNKDYNIKYNPR